MTWQEGKWAAVRCKVARRLHELCFECEASLEAIAPFALFAIAFHVFRAWREPMS